MEITLALEESDLARFRAGLDIARALVETMDECDVVDAAKSSLADLPIAGAPGYVQRQLARVQLLIAVLEDDEFALGGAARREVVAALIYLSDPDDWIPDAHHTFGLLDDAIMVEVLMRDLAPIVAAFERFASARREARAAGFERGVISRKLAALRRSLLAELAVPLGAEPRGG